MTTHAPRRGAELMALAVVGLALLPLSAVAQAPAPAQAVLPGGAQAINETFDDWQAACVQPQGVKRCAASQQQTDDKTKQRVLVVELQARGDKAEGVLILPFGLTLDKGITLKVGDEPLGPLLRFKTCLPQGCVVALNFDAKTTASLRKAPVLTVGAFGDGDQPANLSISLKGFAPALDRAAVLAK